MICLPSFPACVCVCVFACSDDEHMLIQHYCQSLNQGSPLSQPRSPAQILISMETEEKGELERVLNDLEQENRSAHPHSRPGLHTVGLKRPTFLLKSFAPPELTTSTTFINLERALKGKLSFKFIQISLEIVPAEGNLERFRPNVCFPPSRGNQSVNRWSATCKYLVPVVDILPLFAPSSSFC